MLLIFAFNKPDKSSPALAHKGWFDGQEFIPMQGSECQSIDDLYNYDYIQIFTPAGMSHHIPKEYNGSLLDDMKNAYVDYFGESEQGTLF